MSTKYHDIILLGTLSVGYCTYTLLRKAFGVSLPYLTTLLKFNKTDAGAVATAFSIAYGLSKFVGGILSDFCDADLLFASCLLVTSVLNVVFALFCGSSILKMMILWFLQGFFQG